MIVTVGLLPLVSTTVDAADYELPYILAIDGDVYVSDGIFILSSDTASATTVFGYLEDLRSVGGSLTIKIVYSDALSDWVAEEVLTTSSASSVFYRYGASTKYAKSTTYSVVDGGTSSEPVAYWAAKSVVTNVSWNSYEKAAVGSYSNDLTQLPQGITEDAIRDIVHEQLNTQTASGTAAATIINNTTTQYNLYLSGDVSSEEMQSYVSSNLDTLSDLSTTTGNTLSDLMQINNAITYNQAIQDQLLNTASGNVQSMITGYTNTINTAVANYQSGTTSQADTVKIIQQQIDNLNQLIANGTATTTADINAVNAAINAANGSLDSVTGYQDLSQEASEKSQNSDQAELDYLGELTAETTATVEEIAPSQNFSASQASETMEVLDLVWENEFVQKLLPLCAGFMVVCVVLGIRYKV